MSLVNMLFHSSGPNLSLINLHHFPQMRFRRIPSPGAFIHYLEAQTSNEHRILIYHHRGRSSSPLPTQSPPRPRPPYDTHCCFRYSFPEDVVMHWRGVGEPFARRLSCSNAWPLEDAFYSELVPGMKARVNCSGLLT